MGAGQNIIPQYIDPPLALSRQSENDIVNDVKMFQLSSKLKKLHFDKMTSSLNLCVCVWGGGGSKYYTIIYWGLDGVY